MKMKGTRMNMVYLDRSRPTVGLRIGKDILSEGSGGTFNHIDPSTGRPDREIPLAGPAEVDRAVEVAHQAYLRWRDTRPAERRRLLLKLADLIETNRDEFVRRAVLDNGTPITTARDFSQLPPEWTRYYAGAADKLQGRVASSFGPDGEFSYELPQPYGVIGVIITWNAPLNSIAMKVPAALAAGNTVVIKPSEFTPFAADLFGALAQEAGFPEGVVNVLPGTAEAGARLVEHPAVKKISFTGGPITAKRILTACAEQMKPCVLELGGKAANLIFPDADIDAAVSWGTSRAVGTLAGQTCGSPTRMLVHRDIYDDVVDRVVKVASSVTVGDPFDAATDVGPVITEAATTRISQLTQRATQEGATLALGGSRLVAGGLADGYFMEPTVLTDVRPGSEIAQTEVFGPVLSLIPFETEQQAIDIANGTPYGLASYIQTNDLRRAHRVAERLDAGVTLINGASSLAPNRSYGGLGLSGFGREGGPEGLSEFMRVKTIAIT
jgi:aldehyde dehydrogenase (NAD+)